MIKKLPHLMNAILLEGLRVRKDSEVRIDQLGKELELLYEQKEEIAKFTERDVCAKLRNALQVFKKSPSLRKKQLIQIMVPKLVVNEKKDELNFFINPLLDKSLKNEDLATLGFEPILTLRANFLDREKKESSAQTIEKYDEFGCHSEEKSSGSGQLAGQWGAMQTYFFPASISRFYAILRGSTVSK